MGYLPSRQWFAAAAATKGPGNKGEKMGYRHRALALLAVGIAALAVAGSAFAFDCIRVSSSYQGLVQSTSKSGHWLLFDMTNVGIVQADLQQVAPTITTEQAACVSAAYQKTDLPLYFALGFGVAGGFTNGPGVLAANNPNTQGQLGNLKGIDHLEVSPIGNAIIGELIHCGATVVLD
jgi:hypothetical protein